jgi:hypothetical protein
MPKTRNVRSWLPEELLDKNDMKELKNTYRILTENDMKPYRKPINLPVIKDTYSKEQYMTLFDKLEEKNKELAKYKMTPTFHVKMEDVYPLISTLTLSDLQE